MGFCFVFLVHHRAENLKQWGHTVNGLGKRKSLFSSNIQTNLSFLFFYTHIQGFIIQLKTCTLQFSPAGFTVVSHFTEGIVGIRDRPGKKGVPEINRLYLTKSFLGVKHFSCCKHHYAATNEPAANESIQFPRKFNRANQAFTKKIA